MSGRSTRNKPWNVLIKKNLKIGLALKELEQQHKQKNPHKPKLYFCLKPEMYLYFTLVMQ